MRSHTTPRTLKPNRRAWGIEPDGAVWRYYGHANLRPQRSPVSPVERRSGGHAGRALVVAVAGILAALGIAWGIAVLADRGSVDVRLGDDTFEAGDAERATRQIEQEGPILYQDTGGGDRDIVLQHLGDDPEEGWVALVARPPDTPRACTIEWQEDEQVFLLLENGEVTEDCDGRDYPADGGDLPRYDVEVTEEGRIYVDLWADQRD